MISKKFVITGIIIAVAAIIVVALGVWLGTTIMGKKGGENIASPYSVVYLSDGGIYFGKLSWFPKPYIASPWTIQRQVDKDEKVQISVVPVNKSLWSPVDGIYLNEKQIIAWSALRADGDMAKALANPELLQQQNPQASGQAPAQGQPAIPAKP